MGAPIRNGDLVTVNVAALVREPSADLCKLEFGT